MNSCRRPQHLSRNVISIWQNNVYPGQGRIWKVVFSLQVVMMGFLSRVSTMCMVLVWRSQNRQNNWNWALIKMNQSWWTQNLQRMVCSRVLRIVKTGGNEWKFSGLETRLSISRRSFQWRRRVSNRKITWSNYQKWIWINLNWGEFSLSLPSENHTSKLLPHSPF